MLNLVRRFREWQEREKARYEEENRRCREASRKWETEIKPLPIEEAKRRAEALLADPARFVCRTSPISHLERPKMDRLAPQLREFFERYSEVRPVDDAGERLERSSLGSDPVITDDRKLSDQFLTVGWMGEENQLIVKHGEDTIRTWGPRDEGEDYPSVYHLLLDLDNWRIELDSDRTPR